MEKSTGKAHVATAGLINPIAAANGTGSALFVINLCASIAPVRLDGNNIPGLENYRLYQVARVEDGRTRHRLRLGFFTSESHAESVLTVVRQQYPTAFTTCLCEEDRRFARGYLPQTTPSPAPVAAAVSKPAAATKPAASAAPLRQASAAKQAPVATRSGAASPAAAKAAPAPKSPPKAAAAKSAPGAAPDVVELTWEPETSQAQPRIAPSEAQPKRAGAPSSGLDQFAWEPPSLTPAAASAIAKSASDTAKHPVLKPAAKAQPAVDRTPAAKPPTTKAAPTVAAPASKPDPASSMRVRALELSLEEPPAPPVAKQPAAPAEPFHVGKGVEFADLGIHLQADPVMPKATPPQSSAAPNAPKKDKPAVAAKTMAPPVQKVVQKTAKPADPPILTKPAYAPAFPAKAAQAATTATARMLNAPMSLPELDSTQTIRALTSAELGDEQQEKWFAVQLAVSEQPVNLDAMPRLDIFEAYRLYSVATAGSGKIVHSLRLGFFKEAVSAEAVSGYLKTFFGSPSVMRVSVAEHNRFKDPPSKKPPAPAHEAKVVELSNARAVRPVPTVTMEVAGPAVDPGAAGSFNLNPAGSHPALAPKGPMKPMGASTKRTVANRARGGSTGKYKAPPTKKSLAEQLLEEAREVELSESGIRKLPKNDSLLSRLVDKLTK